MALPGLITWLVLVVACAPGEANGQDPPYRAFTVADGLPSNTVYCTLQDQEGYLWFATDAGVSRFDGLHFTNYTTSNGLVDNEVLWMFRDSKDRVWFLSVSGSLCYWQHGRFFTAAEHPEFKRIRPASVLFSAAEDLNGDIWFSGMCAEAYVWWPGHVLQVARPVAGGIIRLVPDSTGHPWPVAGKGVFRTKDRKLFAQGNWSPDKESYPDVCAGGDGLIGCGAAGLVTMDGTHERVLVPAARVPSSDNQRVPTRFSDGEIWIPSKTGGCMCFTPVADHGYAVKSILTNMNVLSAFEDLEGDRWLSTTGQGVIRIDRQQLRVEVLSSGQDPRERYVSTVQVLRNGHVVLGTAHGSIHELQGDTMRCVVRSEKPQNVRDRVRDLQEGPDGSIWFTTDSWSGRIREIESTIRTSVIPLFDPAIPSKKVALAGMKALAVGTDGHVFAGGAGLFALIDTLGTPTFVRRQACLSTTQRVYAPFMDRDGSLWFETNELLHQWKNGKGTTFPELSDRFKPRITDIDALKDGELVVATAGSGVFIVENGKVLRTFDRNNGLPSDQCRVALVRNGRLLTATNAGAAMIEDPMGSPRIRTWTMLEGLPTNDIQDIDLLEDELLLATPNGLCRVSITPLPGAIPPRLIIARLFCNDSLLAVNDTVEIDMGNTLKVDLHALTFGHPEAVQYACRREKDSLWSNMEGPRLTLAGLAAGEHRFLLRARKVDSGWCTPTALTICIIPPWYSTIWFRVGSFCAAIALVGLLLWLYIRRMLRRQRAEMERQRTRTEERQRIAADVHDDLGADVSHLLMLAREAAAETPMNAPARKRLDAIESNAGSILKKIDEVIWSLDPADDRMVASLEFLQRYTETFAEEHQMEFRTKAILPFGKYQLPGPQRRELFLLLKELLQNIHKHTTADALRFEVEADDTAVRIVLEDNGSPHTNGNGGRQGHGKQNIRNRLDNLRGDLRTDPLGPKGTRTTITLWLRWIHQL